MDLDDNTTQSSAKDDLLGVGIDDFMSKDILDLMGAKDMPEVQRAQIMEKMISTIRDRVLIRSLEMVEDKDVDKVKKIFELDDKELFFEFLKSRNIDIQKIYTEEALIYKAQMVAMINRGE